MAVICDRLLVITGAMAAGDGSAQEKLDIWGLGIILFGMVFGTAPFGDNPSVSEDFDQTKSAEYKSVWAAEGGARKFRSSEVAWDQSSSGVCCGLYL